MESTVNERIKMLIDTLYKGSVVEMSKTTGINRSTLNSIIGKGRDFTVAPGYDVLRKIGEISTPRVNLDWLILGEGNMFKSENYENNTFKDMEFCGPDAVAIRVIAEQLREKDNQINTLLEILKKR